MAMRAFAERLEQPAFIPVGQYGLHKCHDYGVRAVTMSFRVASMLAVPVMAWSLAACATVPASSENQWIGIGQTAQAGPLTIRTNALVEDSRCPMNARCVWAGRVVVDVTLTEAGGTTRTNLILGEPHALESGSVMLDSVEPGKMAGAEQPPLDYRLHFTFTP